MAMDNAKFYMIFPLKPPFREDFPASRVWLPEGSIKSRTSWLKFQSVHVLNISPVCSTDGPRGVCNLFVFQNSKMGLSENEVYPKIIQTHHFQAGLMMINHWIHGFPQNSQSVRSWRAKPPRPGKHTRGKAPERSTLPVSWWKSLDLTHWI